MRGILRSSSTSFGVAAVAAGVVRLRRTGIPAPPRRRAPSRCGWRCRAASACACVISASALVFDQQDLDLAQRSCGRSFRGVARQLDGERGAVPGRASAQTAAAVARDDALHDGQADAGALELVAACAGAGTRRTACRRSACRSRRRCRARCSARARRRASPLDLHARIVAARRAVLQRVRQQVDPRPGAAAPGRPSAGRQRADARRCAVRRRAADFVQAPARARAVMSTLRSSTACARGARTRAGRRSARPCGARRR